MSASAQLLATTSYRPDFDVAVVSVMAVFILTNSLLGRWAQLAIQVFAPDMKLVVNPKTHLIGLPKGGNKWHGISIPFLILAGIIGYWLLPVVTILITAIGLYRQHDLTGDLPVLILFILTLVAFGGVVLMVTLFDIQESHVVEKIAGTTGAGEQPATESGEGE